MKKVLYQKSFHFTYFTVSNNHAAKLIIFLKKSNLHTLIPSCTFIDFWNFWSKTFIFTNEKRKKSNLHALIPSCMFINFLKICHPALLFHPTWLFDTLEYLCCFQIEVEMTLDPSKEVLLEYFIHYPLPLVLSFFQLLPFMSITGEVWLPR